MKGIFEIVENKATLAFPDGKFVEHVFDKNLNIQSFQDSGEMIALVAVLLDLCPKPVQTGIRSYVLFDQEMLTEYVLTPQNLRDLELMCKVIYLLMLRSKEEYEAMVPLMKEINILIDFKSPSFLTVKDNQVFFLNRKLDWPPDKLKDASLMFDRIFYEMINAEDFFVEITCIRTGNDTFNVILNGNLFSQVTIVHPADAELMMNQFSCALYLVQREFFIMFDKSDQVEKFSKFLNPITNEFLTRKLEEYSFPMRFKNVLKLVQKISALDLDS